MRIVDNNYRSSGHAPYRLIEEIVALSVADAWDEAKAEWELAAVFFVERDHPGTCLCGRYAIIEHCVLANRENGNEAIVGNVCVTKFIGLPSEKLFRGLRRIMANRAAALNAETIHHAHNRRWVNPWELKFYLNTCHKRRLTERQRAKREEINARIIYHVHRSQE